jgi:hypothetical protein
MRRISVSDRVRVFYSAPARASTYAGAGELTLRGMTVVWCFFFVIGFSNFKSSESNRRRFFEKKKIRGCRRCNFKTNSKFYQTYVALP